MKYMIHSCNKRLWYVEQYLIPSLIKQGIKKDDIILWNDDKSVGNLKSWLNSCKWIKDNLDKNDYVYHLQDDVVICRDFKQRCEIFSKTEEIVSGFVTYEFNKERYHMFGRMNIEFIWMTFPCIGIPVEYTNEFIFWFETQKKDGNYKEEIKTGKMDDFFFNRYIKTMHPNLYCYNLNPCLVDHIDYMLGGSTINANEHKLKVNRAYYWLEDSIVEKLGKELGYNGSGNE